MFVNGALNDFVDDPHSHRFRFSRAGLVGNILPSCSHIDILSWPGMADVFTAATQFIQPAFLGFLARVPLDDEPEAVFNQNPKVFDGIIARVHCLR